MDKKKLEKLIMLPLLVIGVAAQFSIAGTVLLGARANIPAKVKYYTDKDGIINGLSVRKNTFLGSIEFNKGEFDFFGKHHSYESIKFYSLLSKKQIILEDSDLDSDVDRIFMEGYFEDDKDRVCCSPDYSLTNKDSIRLPLCNKRELETANKVLNEKKPSLNYDSHMKNLGQSIHQIEKTERLNILERL